MTIKYYEKHTIVIDSLGVEIKIDETVIKRQKCNEMLMQRGKIIFLRWVWKLVFIVLVGKRDAATLLRI